MPARKLVGHWVPAVLITPPSVVHVGDARQALTSGQGAMHSFRDKTS
ncbi:hypothetical protein [Streptomyces sioyaensis]